MSDSPSVRERTAPRRWLGLLGGLFVTSTSLSTGFIWACGTPCVDGAIVWTPARRVPLVLLASFLAWWGYLFAHYAWTGVFIDASGHGEGAVHDDVDRVESLPIPAVVGVTLGVATLVVGMVIGVFSIRQGDHLVTNVAGVFFLGGFVVAHFFETGSPL